MTQPDLARDTGCSAALVPSSTAATQFLIDVDAYLGTVKGLAESTRRKYGRFNRRFLDGWCGDSSPAFVRFLLTYLVAPACY